jgi:2,5-furandicarboxylate decarboxylase 1
VGRSFIRSATSLRTVQSLRSFLEKLEAAYPDQLVRVKEAVDPEYGVTLRVDEASRRPQNPALLFEKVKGYSTPILINLLGHIERFNLALEGSSRPLRSRLDFYNAWNGLVDKEIQPVEVDDGPVKELRLMGDAVDLNRLPIVKFYEQDAGRYLTSGLLVARDPEKPEVVNLSYARMQLKGRSRLGTSLHSRGNMWRYFEAHKAAGKPMDVSIIIGAHPAIYLAAAAKIVDEYSTAGSLIGEPVRLVSSETNDLPVPAESEIVLEGRITLEEEDEGPFTEYTGYLSGRSTRNMIEVDAVTMRRDAVYFTIMPSNSDEHLLLSGLPKQARIYRTLSTSTPLPAVRDINWPVSGTHYVCLVSLSGESASMLGFAKQVAMLLLGLDSYVKFVVVVPEEVNISDIGEALGAVASRCDFEPGSGIDVVSGVFSHRLDPSSPREGLSSKMIVDATGPEVQLSGGPPARSSVTLPGVKTVSFPWRGDRRLAAVKVAPGFKGARKLLDEPSMSRCRFAVVVDEDIDEADVRQVLWALATRSQPAEDALCVGGRMVLDATKPLNWRATRATVH